MQKKETNFIISMVFKSLVIISCIVGLTFSYLQGYVGGPKMFLYFTTLSNVWIGIVDVILLVAMIIASVKKTYVLNHKYYLVQQIFTTSIFITGVVYCFILMPGAFIGIAHGVGEIDKDYLPAAIILHMVVPILACLDYFLFTRKADFKKTDFLWAIILPLSYFAFAMIGYFANLDFGHGENYPYFFLNFGSPAGVFGFSKEMPYMGSFYWCLIVCAVAMGGSFLLTWSINKLDSKAKKIE